MSDIRLDVLLLYAGKGNGSVTGSEFGIDAGVALQVISPDQIFTFGNV